MIISSVLSISHLPIHFNVMNFSSCCVLQSFSKNMKLSKTMNKLLGNSKKKKRFYPALPSGSSTEVFDFVSKNSKHSNNCNRRMNVLNKIFMRNISDIMSSGELSSEIADRGIQLSKVNITPTFNQINVHWLANGNKEDDVIEELLARLAPNLRHELSQLQIMGCVPKIEFKKDSSYLKYMEVENILQTADFGDDFEPTTIASDWKSDYMLDTTLSRETKEKSDVPESSVKIPDESLPIMRMDVFGLDHEKIMKRVTQAVSKARAAHRKDSKIKLPLIDPENINEASVLNSKERKKLFKEYLLKKAIEQRRANKRERRSCRPDMLIYELETENKHGGQFFERFVDDYHDWDEYDNNDSFLEVEDSHSVNE